MFTKYEPNEYLGEAQKHKQRAEELENVMSMLQDIESFASGRRPDLGLGDDREWGVSTAHESVAYSLDHSWDLYRRAVAAEIAREIDYQVTEMQMRQDGETCQKIIMWEDKPAGELFHELEYHGFVEVVDEEYREDDVIYTMGCDFDAYYYDKLL